MINKRAHTTALMLALVMMGGVLTPPSKREDEDLTGVPLDELELGHNGIQRKNKQDQPK